MNLLHALTRAPLPGLRRCRVPSDPHEVMDVAPEVPARELGLDPEGLRRVWRALEALYQSGVHPALQVCIRWRGHIVLHRSLGYASGGGPDDTEGTPRALASTETPFTIFSAAKAVTAMVIHKLDEKHVLHLEDRVGEFIPEFARYSKQHITLRHILSHRAGIPNLPPEAIDLELLSRPDLVVEILSEEHPRSRPGRLLAYHAVSGGFVLAEVVRRATGQSIRDVLAKEVCEPLGFRWMNYGVPAADVAKVAVNAFTGLPVAPPVAGILRRALGMPLERVVELSNDPRFLTGVVPSANVVTTAEELSAFYQCLLDEGDLRGVRVFEPRTVRHATGEQNYWEFDFTLGMPIRYGLGFMLGGRVSLFGLDNPHAFGHLGLSNVLSWADPEREIAVALLTSGKPILSLHVVPMVQAVLAIGSAFPRRR
jgi:CubicO group peptidase (beta-lactamase class C family)